MIIAAVELFSEHMRTCLLSSGSSSNMGLEATRSRLLSNLRHLREAYESLIKLDLPSQPLSIVEKVIFEYRVHGMTLFLQRAHKQVKSLADRETWKIVHQVYWRPPWRSACRPSTSVCSRAADARARCWLRAASRSTSFRNTPSRYCWPSSASWRSSPCTVKMRLSVALEQALEEAEGGARTWQQRLLISAANAQKR
ncbi:unnamed protein product [Leptidea sinapis]|uniref:Uncharacterized protein n=1 Tax=Leptidea sinapis TaxID=189913 RepID=A0A5E4PTD4_9NEOP|nr:unnamed protein product [Leptidea sinapis]